jgi:hypothetical protein
VVSAAELSRSLISVFSTGAATFLSSSSSFVLTRLSGPRSRFTATHNSGRAAIEPGTSVSAARNSDHLTTDHQKR